MTERLCCADDQYVWASVTLYLDLINLFLKILQAMGQRQ